MSPRRVGAVLLFAAVVAACGRAEAPVAPDPDAQFFAELNSAQAPYFACVQGALSARSDFTGRLPEKFVEAGMAGALQTLRGKYVAGAVDVDDSPRDAQVAATRSALLALGAYGGGAADPGETARGRVRRTMAMVETTAAIASSATLDCEPSDTLMRLMEKAENEYL